MTKSEEVDSFNVVFACMLTALITLLVVVFWAAMQIKEHPDRTPQCPICQQCDYNGAGSFAIPNY